MMTSQREMVKTGGCLAAACGPARQVPHKLSQAGKPAVAGQLSSLLTEVRAARSRFLILMGHLHRLQARCLSASQVARNRAEAAELRLRLLNQAL